MLLGILAIAGVETFFNFAGIGMEEILQPDAKLGTRHIPKQHFVWRMEGFSDGVFNSLGQRDTEHALAKAPATFRIALIGDSATESLQVPFSSTYGAQLSRLLNVAGKKTEVINFGCSGYGTGQEVLDFEQHVAAYKPDLTILLYNRDAIENARKPTDFSCEPRPYFYLDAGGNLKEDDRILALYQRVLKPNPPLDFLRANSRIFGVLDHANLTLGIHEPLYRKIRGWLLSSFAVKPPRLQQASLPYPPQDQWAVTAALIQRLNEDCRRCGSKFVVVDFPNVVQDPELDRQIKATAALASKNGFGALDLTPAFRLHTDPMSLFLQYHFSARGQTLVANVLAKYLQSYLSQPRPLR